MNQGELKQKKFWFLFWAMVECLIFLFTEHIIHLFEKINTIKTFIENNKDVIEIVLKLVQVFGFFIICKIIYELNQMLAEPIIKISDEYPEYIEQNKRVREKLEELDISSEIGVIKEVQEPTIWEFSNKVIGWNPNWSIELSTNHPNSKKLREIHTSRIEANIVKEIEYIFFENYKIDNNNYECFGIDYFLKALKKIDEEYQLTHAHNKNTIRKGVSKYKIWIVPESIHTNKQLPYYDELKTFKNFIFICGHKPTTDNNMIIFINKKGFVVSNYHKYFIEIFGDNQIYSDLNGHFTHVTQLLSQNNFPSKKIEYDYATNAFKVA